MIEEKPLIQPAAPRRGGRPSPEEGRQITTRILEAAADLFFSQGFEATSIDDISARAGVSKRTFYTRFSAKDEVFSAVVDHRVNFHIENLGRLGEVESGPLHSDLLKIGQALSCISLTDKAVALERILTREAQKFPELARVYHEFVLVRLRGFVTAIFDAAKARGEIQCEDIAFLVEQFIHAVISGPLRFVTLGVEHPRGIEEMHAHVVKVVDLFMNGVSQRSAANAVPA